jgi:hypothetical protein
LINHLVRLSSQNADQGGPVNKQDLQWYTAAVRDGEDRALVMVETYAPNGATTRLGEFHMRVNSFSRTAINDQLRLFDHSAGVVSGEDAKWVETSLEKSFPNASITVKLITID